MVRLLVRAVVFLVAAAVGILVAAQLLHDMVIHPAGFFAVVVTYAVLQSVLSPFVLKLAAKHATALMGGVGLVASFIALLVASLRSEALSISGVGTWIGATVLVWLVTAMGTLLLPVLLVRLGVQSAARRAA